MSGCAKRRGRSFLLGAAPIETASLAEHFLVVAVPVALKESSRIVLGLELKKLFELGIASFNLAALSEAMIGKVIAAVVLNGQVNQ